MAAIFFEVMLGERLVGFVGLAFLAACNGRGPAFVEPHPSSAPRAVPAPAPSAAGLRVSDSSVLRTLDLQFGTSGDFPSHGTSFAERVERYRGFVRERIGSDDFIATLMQEIYPLIFWPRMLPVVPLTLKQGGVGADAYYYLDAPCPSSQRVRVVPWWSTGAVSICRDSYRPEMRVDDRYDRPMYCEYSWGDHFLSKARSCRCGARLVNCARDEAQQDALLSAWNQEPILTAAQVIRNKRPFSEILTMSPTVRSDLGDFVYRRDEFFRSGRLAPPDPESPPSLRPRDPAYGGGILTAPHTLYVHDSQRVISAWLWEDFLCVPLTSTQVHSKQMFQIDNAELRYTGHMELAAMEGCGTCHARLENALKIFSPVTPNKEGMRFRMGAPVGTASFFGTTQADKRGEGPATFAWLGETIARQPEFNACAVQRVEDVIFRGAPVPDEVRGNLRARFGATQDLGRLVEDAIVARYLGPAALEIEAAAPRGDEPR